MSKHERDIRIGENVLILELLNSVCYAVCFIAMGALVIVRPSHKRKAIIIFVISLLTYGILLIIRGLNG